MKQAIDQEHFEYCDPNGADAFCRLRVWREEGRAPIAIVTELTDKPGMSVTDAAAVVWRCVREYMERPEVLIMIEHYVSTDAMGFLEEWFDRVTFAEPVRLAYPQWRRLQAEDVREMIRGTAV